jgi:hypothetical protein
MHDPTAAPPAATTAEQAWTEAFPSWLALLIAVAALGGGLQLVAGEGKDSIAAGMLLLVTALAFTAVALAQGAYGPDAEGPLDLSARLGLGFLGGILGAVAARLFIWLTAEIGLLDLLGLHIGWESAILLGLAPLAAVFWGIGLGVLYPFIPGSTFAARGALVGTLSALYLLLKTLPLDLGAGWLGLAVGPLTWAPVLLYGLVWGLACAATVSWGSRADQAPVSRYLGQSPGESTVSEVR